MTAPPAKTSSVSVVIPVLNAAAFLPKLMDALFGQDGVVPMEVVLVDSMSTDGTRELMASDPRVRIVPITNFSHGRARNLGAREAKGDILVLLTQDALPANGNWLTELLAPFSDPQVAATYSRQIPNPNANPMERYFLLTHFPPGGPVRRVRQGDESLTLSRVFFSNVSSAIRREVLLKFPFDEELIMSEDQQFSRDVMAAGYAIAYQPSSVVFHSHNYSLSTSFRRYFDSVYSLTIVFPRHGVGTSTGMGLRYIAGEVRFMLREYPSWLPYYLLYNCAKAGGTLAAHVAERLPLGLRRRMSLHRYHWKDDA